MHVERQFNRFPYHEFPRFTNDHFLDESQIARNHRQNRQKTIYIPVIFTPVYGRKSARGPTNPKGRYRFLLRYAVFCHTVRASKKNIGIQIALKVSSDEQDPKAYRQTCEATPKIRYVRITSTHYKVCRVVLLWGRSSCWGHVLTRFGFTAWS